MADPSYLAPLIKQILSSPEVDLSVISAKRVREKILVLDPSVEHDYIRRNKAEIDSLIANIFDEVRSGSLDPPVHELNSSQAIPPSSVHTSPVKRKRSDSPTPSSPPTVAVKEKEKKTPAASKKKTGAMTDEEFARQLDSQLNSVRTRGSSSGSSRAPRKSAGKKVRKSKATVGDDSDEDEDDEKPAKKKKKANGGEGGAKGGFGKEFSLSEPLADMLQVSQSSRPQVVKKIWEYIKENGLQNPANKKEIISDAKFRAVFNMDKVGMFQMNKLLGDHLFPLEG